MGSLESAILAIVSKISAQPAPSPAPGFIPSPAVPSGLTLRHTYTTSQTPSKTGWPEWVYVVAVGGGGGAFHGGNAQYSGGGGGACVQGWAPSASVGAITIGAGASGSSVVSAPRQGGTTTVGGVRASGGGSGYGGNTGSILGAYSRFPSPGAAPGGGTIPIADHILIPAYGLFAGGVPSTTGVADGIGIPTSGGGAVPGACGGSGHQGPGGGGASEQGGNSLSPTGTSYTGGAGVPSSSGGGGAGILGNGGNGSGSVGGQGGSGGGGGGAGGSGGNGGNGAVLIFY